MTFLINNTHRATCLEIAHYLANTCRQNAAATGLANGLSAAIVHHNAALNFGTEGQPALAKLQAIFTAHEKGTNLFALQDTGNGILFGAAGNNQLNTTISSSLSCLDFRCHATGTTG